MGRRTRLEFNLNAVVYFVNSSTQRDEFPYVLFLQPNSGLGPSRLRSAGDIVALARQAKHYMREFVKLWNAKRLLLFYFGPLSGACFIGHRLNAVCREIQIMEHQQPGYAPSFLLK